MERQRDHRLYRRQVYGNISVVQRSVFRSEFFVIAAPLVFYHIGFDFLVRFPHGAEAGRFRSHDVDTVPVFYRQVFDAFADKFHDLVLDKAVREHRADDRQSHVLRTYSLFRSAFQFYGYYFGVLQIVSFTDDLFYKFGTAFAYRHCAQSAVTSMGIGTQNHFTRGGEVFAHKSMYDGKMRRNVNTAVFFSRSQTENVVVLVDRAAYGAKRVVTVGQDVRNGKFFQSYRTSRLNDTYVGDVVRSQSVEFDSDSLSGFGCDLGMRGDYFIRHRLFVAGIVLRCRNATARVTVFSAKKFYHTLSK